MTSANDRALCDFCGNAGGFDMSGSYHRQGRGNQGAMTPLWAPAEFSPTLDAVACPRCFTERFYKLTSRSPAWPRHEAPA